MESKKIKGFKGLEGIFKGFLSNNEWAERHPQNARTPV
jgi:hypothetical protein